MPIGYTPEPSGIFDRLFRWMQTLLTRFYGKQEALAQVETLTGFRQAQRLAYDTVLAVSGRLYPGITEREAAGLLADYLKAHHCERYLHRPFAWFGNHSRFDEYKSYDDYHPGDRKLAADDVAILDVSPIVNGYIGDVGYTFSLAPNQELAVAREFLLELRAAIPAMFMSDMTPADIWQEVDRRIQAAGYDNIHSKYPFCTLGHRVFRVKPRTGREKRVRVGRRYFGWFSLDANLAFLRFGPAVTINANNQGKKLGVWAIEPHIGWNGSGAKFEEILVVEPERCYWLDDDVPHVVERQSPGGGDLS